MYIYVYICRVKYFNKDKSFFLTKIIKNINKKEREREIKKQKEKNNRFISILVSVMYV